MNNLSKILLFIVLVLMVFAIGYIDFDDLSWANNSGSYILVLSTSFTILGLIVNYRYEKHKEK